MQPETKAITEKDIVMPLVTTILTVMMMSLLYEALRHFMASDYVDGLYLFGGVGIMLVVVVVLLYIRGRLKTTRWSI